MNSDRVRTNLQRNTWGALSVSFSSIAIELNVPRDDFSQIANDLTFVTLGHGFKKAGSVLAKDKSDYITRYLHNWMVLRMCIVFTIGESPRVCSKYSNWYYILLI